LLGTCAGAAGKKTEIVGFSHCSVAFQSELM
jgi:hypothetical protein